MRASIVCLVVGAGLLSACGGDDDDAAPTPQRVSGTPDPAHARAVARDPYKVTCRDLSRQTLHPESAKLVIQAEFDLAKDPLLREQVAKETRNRIGRSVYYALTELCKGAKPSYEPGRDAVEAVSQGKYLAARHRPG